MNTAKGQTRFGYSGAMAWNNLPESLKSSVSLDAFQRNLKKHILEISGWTGSNKFYSAIFLYNNTMHSQACLENVHPIISSVIAHRHFTLVYVFYCKNGILVCSISNQYGKGTQQQLFDLLPPFPLGSCYSSHVRPYFCHFQETSFQSALGFLDVQVRLLIEQIKHVKFLLFCNFD